jgi:hypothetical protein
VVRHERARGGGSRAAHQLHCSLRLLRGLKLANVRRRCIVSGIVRVRLTIESPPFIAPVPKTQKYVRQMADNSQTTVRQWSDSRQTAVRLLSDSCQTDYKSLAPIHQNLVSGRSVNSWRQKRSGRNSYVGKLGKNDMSKRSGR